MKSVKKQLYDLCADHLQQRITEIQQAIQALQQAANEETKSSAGDKYETGRAMAQLEIEKYSTQLSETVKLQQAFSRVSADHASETIVAGSLVITNQGNFYITVSLGQLVMKAETYFMISQASPLAQKMLGQKVHSQINFQGRNFMIQEIL